MQRHLSAGFCSLMVLVHGGGLKAEEQQPVTVAASPKSGGHIHPSICRTKDGTLIVVYKGANVLMRARSTDGGKTWEQPEAITTTAKRPDVIREVKKFEIAGCCPCVWDRRACSNPQRTG